MITAYPSGYAGYHNSVKLPNLLIRDDVYREVKITYQIIQYTIMKKLQLSLTLISLLVMLMLPSCTKSGDCTEVEYDTPITIVADATYCFPDGAELLVNSLNNKFCPCNAICVWEGQMTLDVQWTDGSGHTSEGSIGTHVNAVEPSEELMGLLINVASQPDSVIFATPCTVPSPSPEIIEATVVVSVQ